MSNPSPAPAEIPRRPRLHTPGFSDLLGDRLLTFDNSTATSLELLRFRREFSDAPGFEAALRKRVDELIHLRHPSIGTVRGVEWLGAGEGLALVSHHTAGRRLSEVLQDARGSAFAIELIRQLAPALAALQRQSPGMAHGLLTSDRIIVTREGRLVIVEHVLASAIAGLRLPARQLQAEFGLAVPTGDDVVALDPRRDVVQLGMIALSLLLGKRIDATAYPHEIRPLLDQSAVEDSATAARLREWLERALQFGAHPFATAEDANRAFERLPNERPAPAPVAPAAPPVSSPAPVSAATPAAAPVIAPTPAPGSASVAPAPAIPLVAVPSMAPPASPAAPTATSAPPAPPTPSPASTAKPAAAPSPAPAPATPPKDSAVHQAAITGKAASASGPRSSPALRWALALLAIVAIAEGVIIAGRWLAAPVVVMGPPTPPEFVAPQLPPPAPVTTAPSPVAAPFAAAVAPPPTALESQPSAPESTPGTPAPDRPAPPAAPAGRFGGVRINSPVELQVFEGGVLVGSTAGPIAAADGRHVFDLVNETLGFRTRTSVEVRAGQLVSVPVTLPSGRININAAPWAEVAIDGRPAGQTPLANLEIPIGTHEILFRHPEFGEQRHTVVVKSDEVTRVSANFRP